MGDKALGNALVYQKKVFDNLEESYLHLQRIKDAFIELSKKYDFPLVGEDFDTIKQNKHDLAFSDQCIYRFSKLQDCMGAKLFKSLLLYQGENVNKPFLDILNQLEVMDIIDVDEWFEIRDLRNEIAHDYENNDTKAKDILNAIYVSKNELEETLDGIRLLAKLHK